MSQENVELVASIYSEPRDYVARFGPHATEAMRAELRPLYDPEYEFHAVLESDRMVHRGFDGYLDFMGDWLVPWKSYTIAADDVRDLEPDRVVVLTRHRGQLKGGGGEVRTLGSTCGLCERGACCVLRPTWIDAPGSRLQGSGTSHTVRRTRASSKPSGCGSR